MSISRYGSKKSTKEGGVAAMLQREERLRFLTRNKGAQPNIILDYDELRNSNGAVAVDTPKSH